MQILVLLGMYFDAVVVFVKPDTFIQIGTGHTVLNLCISEREKKNTCSEAFFFSLLHFRNPCEEEKKATFKRQ